MAPRNRLYFESRYRKLVRDLPQTVFYCPACKGGRRRRRGCPTCDGFGKLTRDSVQELIARKLLRACGARKGRFHGAGREDMDVRMLGRGRPFVFEVHDPKRPEADLDAVVDDIHAEYGDRIRIDPLRPVPRRRIGELKEAHHRKRYRIGVAVGGAVDPAVLDALAGRSLLVRQRTPERVVHRRADRIRERQIELRCIAPTPDDPELAFEVDVDADHGTYVKEFVSGDGGRTESSLAGLLGVPARCARLDVLEILDAPVAADADTEGGPG